MYVPWELDALTPGAEGGVQYRMDARRLWNFTGVGLA